MIIAAVKGGRANMFKVPSTVDFGDYADRVIKHGWRIDEIYSSEDNTYWTIRAKVEA